MTPPAYFGINSSGVNLAINLLILFAVVVYLSLVYWTYNDARRRIADPLLVLCATVLAVLPFAGTVIYMILRPPDHLEDLRERELEVQAAEAQLLALGWEPCPHCDEPVSREFLICPACLRRLRDRCTACAKPLESAWTVCPYCETEVPGAVQPEPPRRRARRRSAVQEETREFADFDMLMGDEPTVAPPD